MKASLLILSTSQNAYYNIGRKFTLFTIDTTFFNSFKYAA